MKHKIIGSSNIDTIDYDHAEKTLKVVYKNGAEYWYQPITATQHTLLMNSESKGSHLRVLIKNKNIFVTKRGGGTRTSIVEQSETVEKSNSSEVEAKSEDLVSLGMNFHQILNSE